MNMQHIENLKDQIAKEEQKEKNYNRLINEDGEGYYAQSPKLKTLRQQLYFAEQDSFAAVWTLEVTLKRRDVWNSEVQAMLKKYAGKASRQAVLNAQEKVGFTMDELSKAVKLHKMI